MFKRSFAIIALTFAFAFVQKSFGAATMPAHSINAQAVSANPSAAKGVRRPAVLDYKGGRQDGLHGGAKYGRRPGRPGDVVYKVKRRQSNHSFQLGYRFRYISVGRLRWRPQVRYYGLAALERYILYFAESKFDRSS